MQAKPFCLTSDLTSLWSVSSECVLRFQNPRPPGRASRPRPQARCETGEEETSAGREQSFVSYSLLESELVYRNLMLTFTILYLGLPVESRILGLTVLIRLPSFLMCSYSKFNRLMFSDRSSTSNHSSERRHSTSERFYWFFRSFFLIYVLGDHSTVVHLCGRCLN